SELRQFVSLQPLRSATNRHKLSPLRFRPWSRPPNMLRTNEPKTSPFRVGVTRDFLRPDGTLAFGDIGLPLLDEAPGVSWEFLAEAARELRPEQVRAYDALLVLGPRVTAATLEEADRLALVARFGVGYDSIDVDACTRAGVLLTITPDGVRRPVAMA